MNDKFEDQVDNAMRINREQKEDAAVEYFESQAKSQPEPITKYENRRGE